MRKLCWNFWNFQKTFLASSDSPYSGVDIPIRVAITETLNAKFLGVGEENTKIATNAEIYIDFGVASIRFLNDNHQLLLKVWILKAKIWFSFPRKFSSWASRKSVGTFDFSQNSIKAPWGDFQ